MTMIYSALPSGAITPAHTAMWQGLLDLFFVAPRRIGRRLPDVLSERDGKPITGPWRYKEYRETTKSTVLVYQAATLNVMAMHLSGNLHHGQARAWLQCYAASEEGQSVYTAIDLDVVGDNHSAAPEHYDTQEEALAAAHKLIAAAQALGLTAHLEVTKSGGYRVWVFHHRLKSSHARDLGRLLVLRAGLHAKTEVFPAQAFLVEGQVGSAVFVPYNYHNAKKGRQVMLNPDTLAVRMVEEFVADALAHRSDPALVERIVAEVEAAGELKATARQERTAYDGGDRLAVLEPGEAAQSWAYQTERCAALGDIVRRCEGSVQISRAEWFALATHLRVRGDWGYNEFHRLSQFDGRYNEHQADALIDSIHGGPMSCTKMECGRDPQNDCGLAPGKNNSIGFAYRTLPQLPMVNPNNNMIGRNNMNNEIEEAAYQQALHEELAQYASMDDVGNQMRFVRRFGRFVRYCDSGDWYTWNGQVWEKQASDGEMREMAIEVTRQMSGETDIVSAAINALQAAAKDEAAPTEGGEGAMSKEDIEAALARLEAKRNAYLAWRKTSRSARKIADMVAMARTHRGIRATQADFDRDHWLLTVQNGTIDLKTGMLRPARTEDMLTRSLSVSYDPDAKAPLWDAFLQQVQPDRSVREYIQRFVGCSLTGVVKDQVFLFFFGQGANGKGTILDTLEDLLGDHHARVRASVIAGNVHQAAEARFGLETLVGRRLVTFGEIGKGAAFDEALLKNLTGQDTVQIEAKGRQPYPYKPIAKYILSGNDKPRASGGDPAVWRRMRLVPFDVVIPLENRDLDLREKLLAELPGIFNWALRGLEDYQKRGIKDVPEIIQRATAEYQEDSDVLGDFLAEKVVIWKPGAKDQTLKDNTITASNLYHEYSLWSMESGHKAMAVNTLSARLKERGLHKGGGRQRYVWVGIRLRTGSDDIEDAQAAAAAPKRSGPEAEGTGSSPAPPMMFAGRAPSEARKTPGFEARKTPGESAPDPAYFHPDGTLKDPAWG